MNKYHANSTYGLVEVFAHSRMAAKWKAAEFLADLVHRPIVEIMNGIGFAVFDKGVWPNNRTCETRLFRQGYYAQNPHLDPLRKKKLI